MKAVKYQKHAKTPYRKLLDDCRAKKFHVLATKRSPEIRFFEATRFRIGFNQKD